MPSSTLSIENNDPSLTAKILFSDWAICSTLLYAKCVLHFPIANCALTTKELKVEIRTTRANIFFMGNIKFLNYYKVLNYYNLIF